MFTVFLIYWPQFMKWLTYLYRILFGSLMFSASDNDAEFFSEQYFVASKNQANSKFDVFSLVLLNKKRAITIYILEGNKRSNYIYLEYNLVHVFFLYARCRNKPNVLVNQHFRNCIFWTKQQKVPYDSEVYQWCPWFLKWLKHILSRNTGFELLNNTLTFKCTIMWTY